MPEYDGYTVDIATINSAHGVRGQMKATCYSDVPDRMTKLQTVCVRPTQGSAFLSEIVEAKQLPHRPVYLIRLAGIDNRDQARSLSGASICTQAGQSPQLPEGTYYVADLIGLQVVTDQGQVLGRITEVIRTGANDVYELDSGLLIPAITDVIREVNLADDMMVITPLAGMLE